MLFFDSDKQNFVNSFFHPKNTDIPYVVFSLFSDSEEWAVHVLSYKSTDYQPLEFSIPNVFNLKDVCKIMAAICRRQGWLLVDFTDRKMAGIDIPEGR